MLHTVQSEVLPAINGQDRYLVMRRSLLSGGDIESAQAVFDGNTQEPAVSFRFNEEGRSKFGKATAENVGKPFAIVLDGKVISAPVIREPITGGSGQISGAFTAQQARDMAVLLQGGALPVPLKVTSQSYSGPAP